MLCISGVREIVAFLAPAFWRAQQAAVYLQVLTLFRTGRRAVDEVREIIVQLRTGYYDQHFRFGFCGFKVEKDTTVSFFFNIGMVSGVRVRQSLRARGVRIDSNLTSLFANVR